MATVTRIDARLRTGNRNGAGTDGDIYLGIGGREFYLDSAIDDFEQNSDRTYVLGAGANVNYASSNNPQTPYQVLTEQLDKFPVYIRFVPRNRDDNWNLEAITVTVNPGPGQIAFQALGGSINLWLGVHSGLYCYLLKP